MNNAVSVAWRIPCARARVAHSSGIPSALLRSISAETRSAYSSCTGRSWSTQNRLGTRAVQEPFQNARTQAASSTFSRSFKTSSVQSKRSKTPRARGDIPPEDSLPYFTVQEIDGIFGTSMLSPAMGNKALQTLQSRRISGTLDLDLPNDISKAVPQVALDNGLEWLRANHPMDEDAAIMRRIEREEKEEEEKLIRRAEQLGIYKPQSGHFGVEKAKENDVYGRSVLQEVREENEKRNKLKEEEERQKWLEGEEKEKEEMMKRIQKNTKLAKYESAEVMEGNRLPFLFIHVQMIRLLTMFILQPNPVWTQNNALLLRGFRNITYEPRPRISTQQRNSPRYMAVLLPPHHALLIIS